MKVLEVAQAFVNRVTPVLRVRIGGLNLEEDRDFMRSLDMQRQVRPSGRQIEPFVRLEDPPVITVDGTFDRTPRADVERNCCADARASRFQEARTKTEG